MISTKHHERGRVSNNRHPWRSMRRNRNEYPAGGSARAGVWLTPEKGPVSAGSELPPTPAADSFSELGRLL